MENFTSSLKALRRRWMKRSIIAVLLLILVALAPYIFARLTRHSRALEKTEVQTVSIESTEDAAIRVGAYNIAHGRGGKVGQSNWTGQSREALESHLTDLAALVQNAGINILVLNEVDFDCTWSHGINQAEFIAEKAGLHYVLTQNNFDAPFPPFRSYRFGNAILSKFPISNVRFIPVEPLSKKEALFAGNHDLVACDIALGEKGVLQVVAIHLEYRKPGTRSKAINALAPLLEDQSKPTILLGDFNATLPGLPGHQDNDTVIASLLEDGFVVSDPAFPLTYPAHDPNRRIDWILTRGAFTVSDPVTHESKISDHRMISAEIR